MCKEKFIAKFIAQNFPATAQGVRVRVRGSAAISDAEKLERAEKAWATDELRWNLCDKGGSYWESKDGLTKRVYFERSDEEYRAEIKQLRAEAGGFLSDWPNQKLGYVDLSVAGHPVFRSTRTGIDDEAFKQSVGCGDVIAVAEVPAQASSEIESVRSEAAKKAAVEAKFLGLPALKGTERQVAWAEQIRGDAIKSLHDSEELAKLLADKKANTARYWIDAKSDIADLTKEF